jgi:hypothetical protein
MKLTLHVDLTPDPTLPGSRIAEVRELPGICVAVSEGEDPVPVIDDLLESYFRTLADIDQLETVILRLLEDQEIQAPRTPRVPEDLSWSWHLVNEARRLQF